MGGGGKGEGEGNEMKEVVRVRVLCLHGFRTSGSILQKQVGKWEKSVLERMDLCFPDAPFPAQGKSDVEEHFPPPYYEWFQFNPVSSFSFITSTIPSQILKFQSLRSAF
jgi:hypothetical protein